MTGGADSDGRCLLCKERHDPMQHVVGVRLIESPAVRLARAERDAVDLHKALAEAIKRLRLAHVPADDLLEVLDRTSKPTPADLGFIT